MGITNSIVLPKWLDDYIFGELGAKYYPACANMTNIDDGKEETLNYLGTYFPRSYAESYFIFKTYLKRNPQWLKDKNKISIFDFGCGTGGEIIGLVTALDEERKSLDEITIKAMDGNSNHLRLYGEVMEEYSNNHCRVPLINNKESLVKIEDLYDLSIANAVFYEKYDIFMSFKSINEFDAKQRFESSNPYQKVIDTFLPKVYEDGILLIEDLTFQVRRDEWLVNKMNDVKYGDDCVLSDRNEGLRQEIIVTHSKKNNDISKVAWRIIKHKL